MKRIVALILTLILLLPLCACSSSLAETETETAKQSETATEQVKKDDGKIVFFESALQKNSKEQTCQTQFHRHQQREKLQQPVFRNKNTQ